MKTVKVRCSGWNEVICYSIAVPEDVTLSDVRRVLTEDARVTMFKPRDWTSQIAARCQTHGWSFGCGIDGAPDIEI